MMDIFENLAAQLKGHQPTIVFQKGKMNGLWEQRFVYKLMN